VNQPPEKGRKTGAKYALVDVMTPPDLQLPDDIETLKAMVLAMAENVIRHGIRTPHMG